MKLQLVPTPEPRVLWLFKEEEPAGGIVVLQGLSDRLLHAGKKALVGDEEKSVKLGRSN